MKKIAVGAFIHESNTFSPLTTTEDDFRVLRGQEIYKFLDFFGPVKGIFLALSKAGRYEVEPTIFARALPSGEVDKSFYLRIRDELLGRIGEIKGLSAVILALHGSMRVREIGDGEGDLLSELRRVVPRRVPIMCSLDMHATVTDKMLESANAFVGFKTAPHLDTVETGAKVADLTMFALDNDLRPKVSCERIPMLVAGEQSETKAEPMKSLMAHLRQLEEDHAVLSASYFLGFPWADAPDNGACSVAITLDDKAKASRLAKWLADRFWEKRSEFDFTTEAYSPNVAIEKAITTIKRGIEPVFVSDSGDNPTAGAPEDNVNMLSLLNEHSLVPPLKQKPLIVAVADSEACEKCSDSLGKKISLRLGGKMDSVYSEPAELECTVEKVVKGWGELSTDLALVATDNVEVVIASNRVPITDPKMLLDLGIDPTHRELIVVKSGYLFDAYQRISAYSMLALTTGCTDEILTRLPFRNIKRPIFPFDKDFQRKDGTLR